MKAAYALALEIYWANEQPKLERPIERLLEALKEADPMLDQAEQSRNEKTPAVNRG